MALRLRFAMKWASIDQKTISDIETGAKRVTELELIAIAQALGFDAAVVRRIGKLPEA
jgi:hypothetical protein